MFSAEPVCSCAAFCCNYRTWDRGCSAHPVFPAPSGFLGRKVSLKISGASAPRAAKLRPLCFDIDFGNAQIGLAQVELGAGPELKAS